ncbi:hypothetical protein [Clostridium thermobutyricum]|uniref:hypothetical protein n=1 Tax=Clostridium thermobutyricum TaxID=29372 RepID=UPI0018AA4C74|nr:hypothetical protein [Clostridium thermobutyricum]
MLKHTKSNILDNFKFDIYENPEKEYLLIKKDYGDYFTIEIKTNPNIPFLYIKQNDDKKLYVSVRNNKNKEYDIEATAFIINEIEDFLEKEFNIKVK